MLNVITAILLLSFPIAIALLVWALRLRRDLQKARAEVLTVRASYSRFDPVTNLEDELAKLRANLEMERKRVAATLQTEATVLETTQEEKARIQAEIAALRQELDALHLDQYARDFGLFEPRYNFDGIDKYRVAIDENYAKQKSQIKTGQAARCDVEWTVEGSKAKGKKMTEQEMKLMLLAFNGECEALIAKVRFDNVKKIEEKITKTFESINKLGKEKQTYITTAYLKLKLAELNLVYEFQDRKQHELEEQRQIREQMRDEERAQRELERAQLEAEREAERYTRALEKAQREVEQAQGAKQQKLLLEIERLQSALLEANATKERVKSQAELTRSGYVYIISNLGSFGEDVFKIGMTRRLDPMDRVLELGDASVPFPFDVHAMIYTPDAPKLEATLHRAFDQRRLNLVNFRKEFFRVPIAEIVKVAQQHHGEVRFTMAAEAADWRKSQAQRSSQSLIA